MDELQYSCPPTQYRFSERLFRRYESVFQEVLSVHGENLNPEKIIQVSLGGSGLTHKHRLNDTYRSLIANKWETSLNVERLTRIWELLTTDVVKERSNVCIIKVKKNIKDVPTEQAFKFNKSELIVNNPTEIELRALFVLQNYQTLGEVVFEVTNITEKIQQKISALLPSFPNIVIDYPQVDDPSRILII